MSFWRTVSLILAGVVTAGLLAACGTTAPTATPTQAAATEEAAPVPVPVVQAPAPTGETAPAPATTVTAEEPVLGGSWDYYGSNLFANHDPHFLGPRPSGYVLFNGLIQPKQPIDRTKGIEFEPYLATEWSTSADGTKWRFKLRQGVTWHDGEVFNADDVVATIRRVLDPDILTLAVLLGLRGVVVKVDKIDDYTVEVDTGKPDSTLFGFITTPVTSMVPEHLIRGDDPTSKTDVEKRWKWMGFGKGRTGAYGIGTGPFKVTEWKQDEFAVLSKNPNYFKFDKAGRRLPYMDRVRYFHVADGLRRVAFFVAGKSEYSQGTSGNGMALRDAQALCKTYKEPGCQLHFFDHGFLLMMTNPEGVPIFRDPRANTALRYGLDAEYALNRTYSGGTSYLWVDRLNWSNDTLSAKEQYELLPWSNPARKQEFDDKAKKLVADLGYPGGVDLPYPMVSTGQGGSPGATCSFLDAASRAMDEIYRIGFKTNLECRAGLDMKGEVQAGHWSLFHEYPDYQMVDPGVSIIQGALGLSGVLIGQPMYYKGVEGADSRYGVIQKTLDRTKQGELYKDIERYMADPTLSRFAGYYARVHMAIRPCVHNYAPGGIWLMHFAVENVWLTGDCRN